MTLITKGMGAIMKKGGDKALKEVGKKFKKYLEKKKGKDLDWDDVKASAKIFTKK
jgi:hypothetical protein